MQKKASGGIKKNRLNPQLKNTPRVEKHEVFVDNPFYQKGYAPSKANPPKIKATYNPKSNPALRMYQHNHIDLSQLKAAVEFQKIYENARHRMRAVDYSAIKVDNSIWGDSFNQTTVDNIKRLEGIRDMLGREGYYIVARICGECVWIKDIDRREYSAKKIGKNLKEALSALARYFGYDTRNGWS